MMRHVPNGWVFLLVTIVGLVAAGCDSGGADVPTTRDERSAPSAVSTPPVPVPLAHPDSSFIYGRVTAGGTRYEGRLRWGGDQEAFWGDYFNGVKSQNAWARYSPAEREAERRTSIQIFGFKFGADQSPLQRQFLARFGDIARIDAHFADVQVTLKSGTVVGLDRFSAGDIDDGVRVWDKARGVVNLDTRQIQTIEFMPTPRLQGTPGRLYGVVRSRLGDFEGFLQWDQYDGTGADTLDGGASDRDVNLRYDSIRSIARQSRDSAVVTLRDGQELVLSRTREVGRDNRGTYVDDVRYGRVLIGWEAFERVDFRPNNQTPSYGDFPRGRPLEGSVTTYDNRRLAGRLVYDFDESETSETLDVSFQGVDYAIPFDLIASIVPPDRRGGGTEPGTVTLHTGEQLPVEHSGDVGERNAGVLVFVAGREAPEYVKWTDVAKVDFERPAAPSHR